MAIEGRALSSVGTGAKSYTRNLIKALDKLEELKLTVIKDQAGLEQVGRREQVVPWLGKGMLWWWLNMRVIEAVRESGVELTHFTKADVPVRKNGPVVVTVYDVIPLLFPEAQNWSRKWYWPRALERCALYSDYLITISEASRRDIIARLGVDESRVVVTRLAIDTQRFLARGKDLARRQVEKLVGPVNPYLLFVGTRDKRKNIAAVVEAFTLIGNNFPHDLVIAGRPALADDGLKDVIKRSNKKNKIRLIDFVADDDLPALYEAAEVLVWPSIYEGWGFPPQEAMACGLPVVTSNGGSLPEVVGEAGKIVEYESKELRERLQEDNYAKKLAVVIGEVLGDKELRSQMSVKGVSQARKNSWEGVAVKTFETYKQAL